MKFEFTGRHIQVTAALRAHVREQFSRSRVLTEGKPLKAHVIIEVERGRHRSEIILKWRDRTLTAHTSMADMYQSLSKTVEKLEKQVVKSKDKLIDRHQKRVKAATAVTRPAKGKQSAGIKIVTQRGYRVRTMSQEEAATAIARASEDFVVFNDSDTKSLCVIYKRPDGKYGLIAP